MPVTYILKAGCIQSTFIHKWQGWILVHDLATGSNSLPEVCWIFAVPSARLNKWPASVIWPLGNLIEDNPFSRYWHLFQLLNFSPRKGHERLYRDNQHKGSETLSKCVAADHVSAPHWIIHRNKCEGLWAEQPPNRCNIALFHSSSQREGRDYSRVAPVQGKRGRKKKKHPQQKNPNPKPNTKSTKPHIETHW